MTRVLLTAFEPFGGEQVNPSQLAVQRLAAQEVDGVELRTAFLPVVYYAAAEALLTRAHSAGLTPSNPSLR